ncbi:MAG: RND family transporter, partial [Pirellulales bacterium]
TRAVLVMLGFHLSMVSSMLSAIVTVVGVAAVIHVIVRFREARGDGRDRRAALIHAASLLAIPIVWASSTDAAGFASLLAAHVGPVRDFGVMMAVGSLLVVVSIALLVPGLALIGRFDPDPRRAWGEGRLEAGLRRALSGAVRRPIAVTVIALLVTGLTAVGLRRTQVETDFTRNFRRDSPIVQAYALIETRLGGAAVWDVIVPAPATLDWPYLAKILRLEDDLRAKVTGLTKVISLADLVRAGAPRDLARIRFGRRMLTSAGLRGIRKRMPTFYQAVYSEDPRSPGQYYLRIMLRCHERQTASERQALIAAVDRIAHRHFPEAQVTGLFVLLTSLVESMVRDQWTTFSVAVVSIALMMTVAFRSPRLALFALLPNALPIVMVTGTMGWFGLKINMGAAMIAAVSMGLSIDSSIHYIAAYRRARRRGLAPAEVLDGVQQTVGRAVWFSTLALIVGFSSLCFSQFVPTITFGVLVSLSMLGGLVGNLLILPLLLRYLGP